ncbi:SprT-like family-domain-containing protein [Syncephalis fuscata]|nr:SprT-like family-domain-containing protein [Syncephalis fuscata]
MSEDKDSQHEIALNSADTSDPPLQQCNISENSTKQTIEDIVNQTNLLDAPSLANVESNVVVDQTALLSESEDNEDRGICNLINRSLCINDEQDERQQSIDCSVPIKQIRKCTSNNEIMILASQELEQSDDEESIQILRRRGGRANRRNLQITSSDEEAEKEAGNNVTNIPAICSPGIANNTSNLSIGNFESTYISDTSIVFRRRPIDNQKLVHRRRNIVYDSDEDEDEEDLQEHHHHNESGNSFAAELDTITDDILPQHIWQTPITSPSQLLDQYHLHSPIVKNNGKVPTGCESTSSTPFFTPSSTPSKELEIVPNNITPSLATKQIEEVDLLTEQLNNTIVLSEDEIEESISLKITETTSKNGRVNRCCLTYCQSLPKRITSTWVLCSVSRPQEHDLSWLMAYQNLTRLQFRRRRDNLVSEFYRIFNQTIFDQLLPHDMVIDWDNKGRRTGGWCHFETQTQEDGSVRAKPYIRLVEKVIDSAERLAEVLVHEMTHAATFVINHTCKAHHGPIFRIWCQRINKIYPTLKTSRTHNFDIYYKYQWRCTNTSCAIIIGRHSKSLDITRKVCGKCYSRFEQIQPVPRIVTVTDE